MRTAGKRLTLIPNVYTLHVVDVRYALHGQTFERNIAKAAANLRKHGVSFEKACEVFFDPLLRLADASGEGEAREAAIRTRRRLDVALCSPYRPSAQRHPHYLGPRCHGCGKETL